MPIPKGLRALFDTTCIICKKTSTHSGIYSKVGWESTSSGTTYPAHIERAQELVRTEEGHVVVSRRKVFLYSATGWTSSTVPDIDDKIILPATHPPTEPQIRSISPVSSERGIEHLTILTET